MAPIPIHTASPITAAKASGVTPQTAAPDQGGDAQNNGSTPTKTSQLPQYTPATPTPTRTIPEAGPPPPQPGAVPRLPTATATASVPPPPRAGESYAQPPEPTAAPQPQPQGVPVPYPAQMAIPAPTTPYAQRGTLAATPTSGTQQQAQLPYAAGAAGGNSTPGAQPSPYAHPPGYQQNPAVGLDNYHQNQNASYASSPFRDDDERRGQTGGGGGEEEGVWNQAVKWAQAAGSKLSAAETEIWRRINKE